MSVAFRRDSDEEHLEPKFELPIPPGANLVTPRGLAHIAERIAHFEALIAAEPDAAAKKVLQRDLRYWYVRQTTAELAPPPAEGEVGIGSTVAFRLNGQDRRLTIVGGDEADPATHSIAFTAPLARAMMGAASGEHVAFNGRADAILIGEIG